MDPALFEDSNFYFVRSANKKTRKKHLCHLGNEKGKTSAKPRKRTRTIPDAPQCHQSFETVSTAPCSSININLQPEDLSEAIRAEDESVEQSSWAERCAAESENWAQERNRRFEDFFRSKAAPSEARCSHCGLWATSSCTDCLRAYACTACDDEVHRWQPLHRRYSWVEGFLAPLKPRESVTEAGEIVSKVCSIPLQCGQACKECGGVCDRAISPSSIIVITERGRFDLSLPVWWCENCRVQQNPTDAELMASGYFRGTPSLITTLFSLDVLHLWRNLKCISPGTSLNAFTMSLEELSRLRGTTSPVDPARFQKAYSEWSYIMFEARRVVGFDDVQCDACGPAPMCVHVDGNSKLYRFKSAGTSAENLQTGQPYHEDTCIAREEDVDAHVKSLSEIGKVSNLCGTSVWAAARNSGVTSAKRSQDVTGLCLATCRHSVVMAALNMYRGEIFAYPHFLHQSRFADVRFFAYDVVCQYWKWLEDVRRKMPSEFSLQSLPYLSVMHATGHSYHCQITYGGFWQEGSGWSVMETTEIANAHLSRAGNTTKHMSRAQRRDELTDQILYWNVQRRERMATHLRAKHARMCDQMKVLEAELQSALTRFGMMEDSIPKYVEELRNMAYNLGVPARAGEMQIDQVRDGLELLSASIRAKTRSVKRDVGTSKERQRMRRLRDGETKRLVRLLRTYEELTGVPVQKEKAIGGEFPWTMSYTDEGEDLDLASKRIVCDIYMRLCRAREEIPILDEEMARFSDRQAERLAYLSEQIDAIDGLLTVPESDRSALGVPSTRYELVRPSDDVLAGLRALFAETKASLLPFSAVSGD